MTADSADLQAIEDDLSSQCDGFASMAAVKWDTVNERQQSYTDLTYTIQFESSARKTHEHGIIQHLADGALLLRAAVVMDKHTLLNNTPGILNLAPPQEMLTPQWPFSNSAQNTLWN